jgi:outer membrane receptor protein involved in Fe transport
LSDRYFRGVSGRGFVTGNPDLEPESSVQTDLAVRHTRGDWSIAVFAYFYRIRDLIERYREGDDFFFRNRGQADLRGLELELAAPLPGGLRLELSAQAQRGEVVDDDQALDDVPPRALLATVRGFPAGPWNWFVRGAVYAGDDRPGPTEIETPAYGLVDAGVGIRFGEDAELQLLGRNLFDHAYPWTPDPGAVLAPGRSLQANLRLSFGG